MSVKEEAKACVACIETNLALPAHQRETTTTWSPEGQSIIRNKGKNLTADMIVWQVGQDIHGSEFILVAGRLDVMRAVEDLLLDRPIQCNRLDVGTRSMLLAILPSH